MPHIAATEDGEKHRREHGFKKSQLLALDHQHSRCMTQRDADVQCSQCSDGDLTPQTIAWVYG